jgi:hypothetical protein
LVASNRDAEARNRTFNYAAVERDQPINVLALHLPDGGGLRASTGTSRTVPPYETLSGAR